MAMIHCSGDIPKVDRNFLPKMEAVLQNLETLRTKHQTVQFDISAEITHDSEKEKIVTKHCKNIDLGIGEARMTIALMSHLQTIDSERQKLRLEIKGLSQDNSWLRKELQISRKNLLKSELKVVQLEEEKKALEFAISVKKYDDFLESEELHDNFDDPTLDLFPEDEAEHKPSPIPSNTFMDDEVRLWNIYNLAIYYASQNNFAVAVPLCRQALDELEQKNGHEHPDVATMLKTLALNYRDQDNYKAANKTRIETMEIWVRCKIMAATWSNMRYAKHHCTKLSPIPFNIWMDDEVRLWNIYNLAIYYASQAKPNLAVPLCMQALEELEQQNGHEHPDVATMLETLALNYRDQENYKAANQSSIRLMESTVHCKRMVATWTAMTNTLSSASRSLESVCKSSIFYTKSK